jgi:hypothetical protein
MPVEPEDMAEARQLLAMGQIVINQKHGMVERLQSQLAEAQADILALAAEIDRLRNVQASQNAAWAGEVERLNAHLSPPFWDHFRGSTGAAIPRQTKDNQ